MSEDKDISSTPKKLSFLKRFFDATSGRPNAATAANTREERDRIAASFGAPDGGTKKQAYNGVTAEQLAEMNRQNNRNNQHTQLYTSKLDPDEVRDYGVYTRKNPVAQTSASVDATDKADHAPAAGTPVAKGVRRSTTTSSKTLVDGISDTSLHGESTARSSNVSLSISGTVDFRPPSKTYPTLDPGIAKKDVPPPQLGFIPQRGNTLQRSMDLALETLPSGKMDDRSRDNHGR